MTENEIINNNTLVASYLVLTVMFGVIAGIACDNFVYLWIHSDLFNALRSGEEWTGKMGRIISKWWTKLEAKDGYWFRMLSCETCFRYPAALVTSLFVILITPGVYPWILTPFVWLSCVTIAWILSEIKSKLKK